MALRGKATAGGRVLHARVLDYMREIDLQDAAVVQVFMPEGRNAWMSLGYAGFIGTVTAMNEKGLAIGEMGGRGEGQWDGIPMSLLLRDVMERAGTVEEALAILRGRPADLRVLLRLERPLGRDPGGPLHAAGDDRARARPAAPAAAATCPTTRCSSPARIGRKCSSRRIEENYGRIDVPKLIEIIKRPVAMESNLHDAIFAPETLEMWFADAGRDTPACDEPYARVNLRELIEFYRRQAQATKP